MARKDREKIEAVAEHLIFLLFVGLPTRLKDSREFWATEFAKRGIDQPVAIKSSNSAETNPTETIDLIRAGQVLREGGKVWQVLSLSSEEERHALLQQELTAEQFQAWQELTTTPDNANFLWTALDEVQKNEQQHLAAREKDLQARENQPQRQLKSAEVEVNHRLFWMAIIAPWRPLINGLARLCLAKDTIEELVTSGKTLTLLRKIITSWLGLLVLFLGGILIALTTNPNGWGASLILVQQFMTDLGLANWVNPVILNGLKTIPTWMMTTFQWFRTTFPTWVQIATGTVVALIPTLKALGEYITAVQKEQARIQGERDDLLKKAQGSSEALAKEVAQLKLQVEQQRQRLGLTANYASLLEFVNDRLDGDDYGQHLGLMQQVKQDLAALSDRLTEGTRNREELKKLFPRGPARVILYIDDLDRCPPNRVVEVLEAVQLLLNTKLFIVVLGIDDRYSARALEEVYRGVLKRGGKPSGIDYLEKIIQIPYRMRPISPATVENYLRAQLQIRTSSNQEPNQPEPAPIAQQTATSGSLSDFLPDLPEPSFQDFQSTDDGDLAPDDDDLDIVVLTPDDLDIAQSQRSPSPLPEPSSDETPAATYLETIAQVTEFDQAEFQILVDCCKQVDITPRTAKRLINIYKILQIIWSTRNQQSPPQPLPSEQDKRSVMSFLALSGRYPTFMRNLFEEIDVLLEEKSLDESQDSDSDNPQVAIALRELLDKIHPQFPDTNIHAQREWRRFTSDIRRMLRDPMQSKDSGVELRLDRQTFELMLSFCFVGDIGYDPDDHRDQQVGSTVKPNPFPIAEELE